MFRGSSHDGCELFAVADVVAIFPPAILVQMRKAIGRRAKSQWQGQRDDADRIAKA